MSAGEANLLGKQLPDLLLVLRWCVLLLGCKVRSEHMLHGQADSVSVYVCAAAASTTAAHLGCQLERW